MKKILSITLLITLLFVSCKKNSDVAPVEPDVIPTGPVYITFSPSVSIAADVKSKTKSGEPSDPVVGEQAGVSGTIEGNQILAPIKDSFEAQVIGIQGAANSNDLTLVPYKDVNTGKALDQKVTFNPSSEDEGNLEGSGFLADKILYPVLVVNTEESANRSATINLKAYSPADATDKVVRRGNLVTFSNLTGQTDVLVSQMHPSPPLDDDTFVPKTGSGQGNALSVAKNPFIDLMFHHALSKVTFKIAIAQEQEVEKVQAAWGTITNIDLIGVPSSVELDLNTNMVKTLSTSGSSADVEVFAGAHTLAAEGTQMGNFLILPSVKKLSIRIKTDKYTEVGITRVYEHAIDNSGKAVNVLDINKHHVITLRLSVDKGVAPEVTMVDWLVGKNYDTEF